jgi:transcriptional repressor OPI1
VQRQNSSSIETLSPTSPLPNSTAEGSPKAYREPLPPIQLTPGSSRAHSPVPGIAELQLPPLDPALYNQSSSYSRHHHVSHAHHRHHHHHSSHEHTLEREADWDGVERARERYGSLGDCSPEKDFDALSLGNVSSASSNRRTASTTTTIREDEEDVPDDAGRDKGGTRVSRMEVDT